MNQKILRILKNCLYLQKTQIMTYEELFYQSMTDQELERAIQSTVLDAYAQRCQQELDRRRHVEQENLAL
jgi:hypothetical protein